MDNTLKPVVTRSSKSKHCDTPVYNRVDAVNNDNNPNYNRNDRTRRTRSRSQDLVWYKYYTKWLSWCNRYNLFSYNRCNRVGSINNNKRRRDNRNNNNRQNYRNRFYYQLLLYLCTIGTPVFAEGEDTNVSNPVAAATGNVTNQAIQFQNNGSSSRQIYGPNIQCNGSTMTFSPFYMGNHSKPFDEFMQPSSYTIAENWGFQVNFMIPLDKEGYKQCKQMAERYEEKMRLEYELTRAHKCAELMQKGFMIRPGTDMYVLCQDIVPIVTVNPPKDDDKKLFGLF